MSNIGNKSDMSLVTKKFIDYHVSWSKSKIEKRLDEFSSQNLSAEMNRFLPQRYRQQLYKINYKIIRQAAVRVIEEVEDFLLSIGN